MALWAVITVFTQTAVAKVTVIELRCENLINPFGIDTPQPRFSWMLAPGSRGLRQTAYQIKVTAVAARGQASENVLWDSGRVPSDHSALVPYAGAPLAAGLHCKWQVRVWDENDVVARWSQPGFFSLGPMQPQDWQGEWIGVDWMVNNEGPLPLLRRKATLAQKPVRALAYVCALGYYELYINGSKIGEDVLSPAVSDYAKRGLYLTHDVTKYLKAGDNGIGLWLGRGWSTAMLAKASTSGPIVKAQIEIEYADGHKELLATDKSWKAHPSHITPLGKGASGDYGGELVEAAKEIKGWSQADYDDASWSTVTSNHPPTSIIAAQMMEANRLLETIAPVSVAPFQDGYVIDMGRNYTGWFELRMPPMLPAGTRIELEYADKRFPDGKFQTYRQRDTYVAKGQGQERFCNRFNYHAFRYAIVKGLPQPPRLQDISGWLISTHYQPGATFVSNHALLNNLYDTVLWTHRCLSLGGYTVDCPHRERLGYGGDSGTSMESAMLNFRTGPFYAKWAADWRDSQAENGDVPHTAPNSQYAGGGPVWSGFCITMPWQTYVSFGDRRVLEKGWPVMQKWLAFIDTKMQDGLLVPFVGIGSNTAKWSFLGDWVPPGRKQGKDRVDDRSTLFFNNCYLVHCLQLASKIGAILNKPEESRRYSQLAVALAQRLHERFLNQDGATYANGEQTYLAMPLLFNITPEANRSKVMAALEKDIVETRHGHLNTGMHGNYYMARYLIQQRRNDLMTMMMSKETYPSYGYMLKNGATTIWEEWDGDNSQIHNTMISIGMWFIAGLAGIQADENYPGFKHFTIAPGFESGLDSVSATCMSHYGNISSAWKRVDNTIMLDIEVPPNSSATVMLPAMSLDKVREGGRSLPEQNGISNAAVSHGLFRCEVTSGTFHFTTE